MGREASESGVGLRFTCFLTSPCTGESHLDPSVTLSLCLLSHQEQHGKERPGCALLQCTAAAQDTSQDTASS